MGTSDVQRSIKLKFKLPYLEYLYHMPIYIGVEKKSSIAWMNFALMIQ